ncbi:glycyl-tRNA synthetase beta chain [Candidatus Koribacter versatilis Ellin345]|uniref:Glycine--tRNA ligase beta subunit n=1 Tax=Koribacter versatilis (strain Ellin345) TaxID=204669 RepID=Q1ISF2_KORVE|nr:glycine--tRNA ligase subunit beta [Candidatus Koribacter versatilis]ABF40198.1 glycyl-tRNA synthetase beta chain [Candidatus Koribacter versatilis Ellin345]
MADFLLEIGTEEIPARMIDSAREELAKRVSDLVQRERLAEGVHVESYSTPRRLAVVAKSLRTSQPDVEEQLMGPSTKVAYKDGEPTPAAHAFAKKAGVDLNAIEKVSTPKGEYIAATVARKGRSASEILSELLPKEINGVYWAKSMYWRPGKTSERFVRPVRWMVALLDNDVVPLEFDGVTAGNRSRGHRILSHGVVTLPDPSHYRDTLAAAAVVVDRKDREYKIRKALDAATRTITGARWREDKDLLDTVVNLTESPSALLGSFDPEYLSLPEEVLVTVMRDHQKYFAVEDAGGKLAPHFLAVLNTNGDPDGLIRHGNERVLRARFNDARFFWNTDQKLDLRQRVELLKSVTFQKDLGSYYDKTCRFQKLASLIAEVAMQAGITVRAGVVHKAALLSKTDLTTELVKEFTELQGVVGGLYAKAQGERLDCNQEVANAIGDVVYDHYKPVSMDDSVPRSIEGAIVAVADKADTIAGMFALGLIPSGSKDPFALRRAANGVVKIIAEHKLPISLRTTFDDARTEYKGSEAELRFAADDKCTENIAAFMRERLDFYLREVKGFHYDVVNAVLASNADDVVDAIARAEAVTAVRGSEDFIAVSAAFKRMKNILKQAEEKKVHPLMNLGEDVASVRFKMEEYEKRAEHPEEAALIRAFMDVSPRVQAAVQLKSYQEAVSLVAGLRKPVDAFFDKVMVMVDDEQKRTARLLLLLAIVSQFEIIADFSEIVTERT